MTRHFSFFAESQTNIPDLTVETNREAAKQIALDLHTKTNKRVRVYSYKHPTAQTGTLEWICPGKDTCWHPETHINP